MITRFENCCCFIGHRLEVLRMFEIEVSHLIQNAVKQSIDDGFTVFLSGMSRGFDVWAAKAVLKEKKTKPWIKLVCIIPYKDFGSHWNTCEIREFRNILRKADYVKYMSKDYGIKVLQERYYYMVDCSYRVISLYKGTPGRTENSLNRAKQAGITIIDIF